MTRQCLWAPQLDWASYHFDRTTYPSDEIQLPGILLDYVEPVDRELARVVSLPYSFRYLQASFRIVESQDKAIINAKLPARTREQPTTT